MQKSDDSQVVCHAGTQIGDVTRLDDDIKYMLIVQVEDSQELWTLDNGRTETVREVMNFYADCGEADLVTGWLLVEIKSGERRSLGQRI